MKNPKTFIETLIKSYINDSPENTLGNAANDKALGRAAGRLFPRGRSALSGVQGAYRSLALDTAGSLSDWLSRVQCHRRRSHGHQLDPAADGKDAGRSEKGHGTFPPRAAPGLGSSARGSTTSCVSMSWRRFRPQGSMPWGLCFCRLSRWSCPNAMASISPWSERHAAHASGLGTFGLCDGLITPVGKAIRCGSVVARISVEPTPRPYTDHRAYCLFFSRGKCRKCIQRCPVGAVSESGHDKARCYAFLMENTRTYVKEHYGFEGYGCGFCQSGVPCESGIPGLAGDVTK